MISLDAAFTSSVRVIHRIHRDSANRRLLTHPARAPGLAIGLILVVQIADLANRRSALDGELANFAGRHLDQREIAFLAEQLRRSAGRANCLAAAPGIQFQVMHLVPGGM